MLRNIRGVLQQLEDTNHGTAANGTAANGGTPTYEEEEENEEAIWAPGQRIDIESVAGRTAGGGGAAYAPHAVSRPPRGAGKEAAS